MFKGDTVVQNNLLSIVPQNEEKISKQIFQEKLKDKADKILENLFPVKPVSQICECKFDCTLDGRDKTLSKSDLVK